MKYAGFSTMESALEHRSIHGGWIFASDKGEYIWFDLSFTPTPIMQHYVTRGMNGQLY